VLPRVLLVLGLHVGHEVPVHVVQGRVGEGVVVVAHAVRLRGRGGLAVLDGGRVEGVVPGGDEAVLEVLGGHPVLSLGVVGAGLAVHRPRVVLAPEPDEPRCDEADAGVAVVLLPEGAHEVEDHVLDAGVVVVGGEGDPVVVEDGVGAGRVDALVDEVLGHAGGPARVVQVEAEDGLVAALADLVQARLER